MPLRRHRAASQADQKLALLAELAIKIDGKQPGTASLTMAQVGVLMEQRDGSPGRADAIAAVQSALGAPAPGGSTHDRFYSKAMGKQGNQAAAYAAALVPGVPEALAAYVAARADAATDAERARALNAAMKRITAAALPAPTHDEYRTAVGCAAYRANGMRLLTMVPTPGFVYLQKYSLSADVVEQLAVSLGPACLVLGKPNGATLVWFNHVTNVNRARVVGAVDPGSNVDVYRVGKSSTENPHAAGKRVNEHSFCWNGSDWELDKRSDAFLLKRWSTVPGAVEGYAQQYVAVGPPGNSEPGELLLAELLGADQISGNPFVNVSPCGPSESDPYLSRGGPGPSAGSPRLARRPRRPAVGLRCAGRCAGSPLHPAPDACASSERAPPANGRRRHHRRHRVRGSRTCGGGNGGRLSATRRPSGNGTNAPVHCGRGFCHRGKPAVRHGPDGPVPGTPLAVPVPCAGSRCARTRSAV